MSLWYCNQCQALTGGSVGAPQCAKCGSFDVAWATAGPMEQTTAKPPAPETCLWTEDEDGNYDTTCGRKYCFFSSGPTEDGFKVCPFCGLNLVEVKAEESDD